MAAEGCDLSGYMLFLLGYCFFSHSGITGEWGVGGKMVRILQFWRKCVEMKGAVRDTL
jgi:hypothetical protein